MRLTNVYPRDWKELQTFVCRYFNQAGYAASEQKNIKTVRGNVVIDVYVKSNFDVADIILVECKCWSTRVPKEKVHAFRTVVTDSGASLGIMISMVGYQSGAETSASMSNVKLFNWDQFLEIIKDKWIERKLSRIIRIINRLSDFAFKYDAPVHRLSKDEMDLYIRENDLYSKPYKKYIDLALSRSYLTPEEIIRKICPLTESYESFLDQAETELNKSLEFYYNFFHIEENERMLNQHNYF